MKHYYDGISDDVKKCDLHCPNSFKYFQNGTEGPESQQHCIETIKVPSYIQGSVVQYWFWHRPRDYSQWKYRTEIENENSEVEKIPTISAEEKRPIKM